MAHDGSANETARAVKSGDASAESVVRGCLERLDRARGLNAVITLDEDGALERAKRIDCRRAAGARLGAWAGVPFAVKDNICTRGVTTTCASRLLEGFVPPYDATAVARLTAEDAVLVAKTNCDEFGMGSSSENGCFGSVRNPHDPARTAGGSSGGSAALVASGCVPLALGSDTGGSVRQPAAFCGVVGLKPTYGRVSRWGLVAFGSSLDQIGPIAATVRDAAAALATIAGADARDATCSDAPPPDCDSSLDDGIAGARVGVLDRSREEERVDPRIESALVAAADALEDAGAELVRAKLPSLKLALAAYYVLATAEASSNLARFDGIRYGRRPGRAATPDELYVRSRTDGFGAEVRRRIMLGTFVLSAGYHDAYYERALRARAWITTELDALLEQCDLLLLPTTAETAFLRGDRLDDPRSMYLSDLFTVPASLGGHPAVSLPAPPDGRPLPAAVQLVGRRFGESSLMRAARCLERRGFRGAVH
jgi:aspartyl-tRNA(Asn)/glutamyl-tRNA(Gln) amidotransferase subunit A